MTAFPDLQGKRGRKASSTKPRAYALYDSDVELVSFLAAHFGCSNSEAVRTAIRGYATSLEMLNLLRAGSK
jgi:hypothetical protein